MKLSIVTISLCLLMFFVPELASAQTPVTLTNPLVFGSVQGLITAFVRALIVLLIPVVAFFIIFAGFKYVTGQGNPSSIADASKALLYALIGGVVILGSFAILSIVENTVNEFRPQAVTEVIRHIV